MEVPDMAQVISATDLTGSLVNGIELGQPATDGNGNYIWDDSRIPDMIMVLNVVSADDELLMALLGGTA